MESYAYTRNYTSLSRSYAFRRSGQLLRMSRAQASSRTHVSAPFMPMMSYTARKYSSPASLSRSRPSIRSSESPYSDTSRGDSASRAEGRHSIERGLLNGSSSLDSTGDRSSPAKNLKSSRKNKPNTYRRTLSLEPLYLRSDDTTASDIRHGDFSNRIGNDTLVSNRTNSPLRSIQESLARVNEALRKHQESDTQSSDAPFNNRHINNGYGSGVLSNGIKVAKPLSAVLGISRAGIKSGSSVSASADYRALPSSSGRTRTRSRIQDPVPRISDNVNLSRELTLNDKLAEARLAQRRAARAEARELRLREIERQQKEKGNDDDEDQPNTGPATGASMTPESTSRTPSIPRSRASLPSNSISRRSSEDSLPDDNLPSSSRELKAELKELQEKFRNSMISNAQLDNEKATLTYEVDFLKDKYSDLEEAHTQLTKDHRRKCSETEQLKKITTKLKEEVKVLRRVLQERDELIQEYGLVLVGEEENGDAFDESYDDYDDPDRMDETVIDLSPRNIAVRKALLSQEASELLKKGAAKGSLDVRLRKYAEDKNELEDEVQRIRLELEEVLNEKRKENGLDHEKQKEASKSINEYKFRIQKAEAEVSTLQANVARLDSLVSRYKASTEELEKSEEELKQEKRRLQREMRDLKDRCDELEASKAYVKRQYEKLLHDRGRI